MGPCSFNHRLLWPLSLFISVTDSLSLIPSLSLSLPNNPLRWNRYRPLIGVLQWSTETASRQSCLICRQSCQVCSFLTEVIGHFFKYWTINVYDSNPVKLTLGLGSLALSLSEWQCSCGTHILREELYEEKTVQENEWHPFSEHPA